MSVVFHLDTDDTTKQSELLGNLKNLKADDSVDEGELAVVLNGDAVKMVREGSEAEEFVEGHLEDGVEFAACSNSLDNRNISEEELIDGVESVSSGVGELTRRQQKGFAYIKP